MEAVADHKVDAGLTDASTTKYWVNNNAPLFKLIGPKLPIGKGYAFFSTKGNTALITRINNAMDSLKADGTFAKIYDNYFGM
jgi:ABC-type amino acid transport substrate-binding protein